MGNQESRSKKIYDRIISKCYENIGKDYDANEYFNQAIEQARNDHQYMPYLIRSISEVIDEEIRKLEKWVIDGKK